MYPFYPMHECCKMPHLSNISLLMNSETVKHNSEASIISKLLYPLHVDYNKYDEC